MIFQGAALSFEGHPERTGGWTNAEGWPAWTAQVYSVMTLSKAAAQSLHKWQVAFPGC